MGVLGGEQDLPLNTMKIKKAVIVHKKSNFQKNVLESRSHHYGTLLQRGHKTLRSWKNDHAVHLRCLKLVRMTLKSLNIDYQVFTRAKISSSVKADLVISVGGDGTFLETSHFVRHAVMMGVNSTPVASVGHFTCCTASDFVDVLDRLLDGTIDPIRLHRIQVFQSGKKIGPLILNDVLLSRVNPAATSRYEVCIQKKGRKEAVWEEQKSSGVWISTAAGSTAAFRSAGGQPVSITDQKFAFLVREPYPLTKKRYHYGQGLLNAGDSLDFTIEMDDSALFFDGPHEVKKMKRGDRLTIKLASKPLKMIR
jgi:NAD+ kinase